MKTIKKQILNTGSFFFALALLLSVNGFAPSGQSHVQASDLCSDASLVYHTLVLDQASLQLCFPRSLPAFVTPSPTDQIQSATASDPETGQEVSILSIPYGASSPIEDLPEAKSGEASNYLEQLRANRYKQGAVSVDAAPTITLFGSPASGIVSRLSLNLGQEQPTEVLIHEWVIEYTSRIWIFRIMHPTALGDWISDGDLSKITLTNTFPIARSRVFSGEMERSSSGNAAPQALTSDLPTPSWWKGDCDYTTYLNGTGLKSYQLGTITYRGLKACGPRPSYGGKDWAVRFYTGAWGAYEWECVELSMRYMYLAYDIAPYSGNGKDVVNNYRGNRLVKIANGTPGKKPVAGDIFSLGASTTYGHTTVVTESNVDSSGNGQVKVIEQNNSSNGEKTYTVKNWVVTTSPAVINWLHDPYDPNDAVGPSLVFTSVPPLNTWYNTPQTIQWSMSDASSISAYAANWDYDPTNKIAVNAVGTIVGSAQLANLEEGQHFLLVNAWDNSVNKNQTSNIIGWFGYDVTPPIGSMSINNNAGVSRTNQVWVSLPFTDNMSGVSKMRMRNSGGAWSDWRPYSSATVWKVNGAINQTSVVEAQVMDLAGNVSAVLSASVRLTGNPADPGVHTNYLPVISK